MNKHVLNGSRIILGLMFFIFGLNGIVMMFNGRGFFPDQPISAEMMTIFTGFMTMKYMLPLVSIIEFVAGVLLLWGKYLNSVVIILTPIVLNILLIHIFVDLSGLVMALVISALLGVIICSRWKYFKPMLLKN